jgi:ubiquinone/menaquinone biosynthesis C-methylase UbiE
MTTNYDPIAEQYKQAKRHPWRRHVEHYTLFELLGDLHGAAVLDLACGEGFITRFLKQAGAGRVLGVDLSAAMIDLGRAEEEAHPLGIDYIVHDAQSLRLPETFDLVTAAYLLNYAQTPEQLLEMCQAIARHLTPGGRFVTVNNNPGQAPESFASTREYGFTKAAAGELREGTPITYTFLLDDGPLEITNYYLSPATHEWALRTAGFREVRWHVPQVSPAGVAEYGADYWSAFLHHVPVIFLDCTR